jgi:hypothetical protein
VVLFCLLGGLTLGERIPYGGLSTFGLILPFQIFNVIAVDDANSVLALFIRGVWEPALIYYLVLVLLDAAGFGIVFISPEKQRQRSRRGIPSAITGEPVLANDPVVDGSPSQLDR